MAYNPTGEDIKLLRAPNKNYKIKVILLDKNNKELEQIQGDLISGNRKIDANSDIRRTCSLSFFVKDNSYTIGDKSKFTSDRKVKIYLGQVVQRTGNIIWYDYGYYAFTNQSATYDATTKQMSITCVDLMNNVINTPNTHALEHLIQAGTEIRTAMTTLLENYCSIKNYVVCKMESGGKSEIPYTLSNSVGTSVYDAIKACRDIYPGYETYFDNDVFICKKSLTSLEDDVIMVSNDFSGLVISESQSTDLSTIKNCVEVWGESIDVDYYADNCSYIPPDNTYSVTISNITNLINGQKIGVNISNKNTIPNAKLKINSNTALEIKEYRYANNVHSPVPLTTNIFEEKKDYVFSYDSAINAFIYIGQYRVHSIAVLINDNASINETNKTTWNCNTIEYVKTDNHPFAIENIGEQWVVFSGGEYDNITSDELGKERAKYELTRLSVLQDSITLEMISIPWLDVNLKVRYKLKSSGLENDYIIKSISENLGMGIMTVELIRCYQFT